MNPSKTGWGVWGNQDLTPGLHPLQPTHPICTSPDPDLLAWKGEVGMRPPINLMLTCRESSKSPGPTTKCLECTYLETERFHRQMVFSFLLLVKGDAVETDIEMSCHPVTQ